MGCVSTQDSERSQNDTYLNMHLSTTKLIESFSGFSIDDILTIKEKNHPFSYKYIIESEPLGFGRLGIISSICKGKNIFSEIPVFIESISLYDIKEINPNLQIKFWRALEISKKIKHLCILNLIDIFQEDGKLILVSEFNSGATLYDKICDNEKFPERKALAIINKILMAINYFHKKKIILRGLDPQDMLFDFNSNSFDIKICNNNSWINFDIKPNEEINLSPYTAPEISIPGELYDEKCDIWSCGVLFYFMLTGNFPYDYDEFYNNEKKHSKKEIKKKFDHLWNSILKDGISSECQDLLSNMLKMKSNERFNAEQCLNHFCFKKVFDRSWTKYKDFQILENLKIFEIKSKLHMIFYYFLLNEFVDKTEKKIIDEFFAELDVDCNGELSKIEFLEGLKHLYTNITEIDLEVQVDYLFSKLDVLKRKKIAYDDFLFLCLDRNKYQLNKNYLNSLYKIIDKENKKFISLRNLQDIFGYGNVGQILWEELIKEFYGKKDNIAIKISYDDFMEKMT